MYNAFFSLSPGFLQMEATCIQVYELDIRMQVINIAMLTELYFLQCFSPYKLQMLMHTNE